MERDYLNREAIKARRLKLNLTMDEAAKQAGMASRQKWNDFENAPKGRNPNLATLIDVATALRCSVCELIVEPYPAGKGQRREKGNQR